MAGGGSVKGRASASKTQLLPGKVGRVVDAGRAPTSPKWPVLKKRELSLQWRRELQGLDLFTVPGFLTAKESESFIQCAEALGFQQQGSRGPKFGEAFRDNGRVSLKSASLAHSLWEGGLSSLFEDVTVDGSRAVGLNPNLRFYRYVVGQRFGQHIDESVEVENGLATQYTLLIYLSGGEDAAAQISNRGQLVGGETVFFNGRRAVAEVSPVAGMALFHIHGERCMLHEAKVVSKGVKYVMRSDVVFD